MIGCSRSPCDWHADGFVDVPTDVTDESQVKSLFREINKQAGRLEVLLNNAGAASMNHSLLTPLATFVRLMNTNLLGTWLVSREAARLMERRKYGRIVNFSSIAVPVRPSGQAAYVAAKSSVESFSQVMAREVADYGITVNVVGATPIATDMTRGVPQDKMDNLIAQFPIKRMGTCEDVSNVVDFFLRPESGAVTGQVICLGGVPNT